jgi:excisionase family DNA binding protein
MTAAVLERLAFSSKEFGQAVNLSDERVRYLLRSGRLRHVRVGRRILISREEVNRFLNGEQGVADATSER